MTRICYLALGPRPGTIQKRAMLLHSGLLSAPALALAACAIAFVRSSRSHRRITPSAAWAAVERFAAVANEHRTTQTTGILAALSFPIVLWARLWLTGRPSTEGTRLDTLGVEIISSVSLYALYRSLRASDQSAVVRGSIIAAAAVMYGIAVTTTHLGSKDLYAYAAYGKLGWTAYVPHDTPFTGSFSPLNAVIAGAWGKLATCPYGPLALGVDWLATRSYSISQTIFELRLLNIVAIGAALMALQRTGVPVPILATIGLDPDLVLYLVADGHNDALAIALILGGIALCSRNRWLAIGVAILAGATKAPYALLALLTVYPEINTLVRLRMGALIAVGVALASAAGGSVYLHALSAIGSAQILEQPPLERAVHGLAALAAVVAVLFAAISRRTLAPAVLLMPFLFAATYPWYAFCGFTYAVVDRRALAAFAILLPVWTYVYRVTMATG
jgi:hypothetical protein